MLVCLLEDISLLYSDNIVICKYLKKYMLMEQKTQSQSVNETSCCRGHTHGSASASLLIDELTSTKQTRRKETTLKQVQEHLAVKQRETDQLEQQLEDEAIQRVKMCQRLDQYCKKIDRRNAGTSGSREEQRNHQDQGEVWTNIGKIYGSGG